MGLMLGSECGLAHGFLEDCSYLSDDDSLGSIMAAPEALEAYIPTYEDMYYGSPWWEGEQTMVDNLIKQIERLLEGLPERAEWQTTCRRRALLRLMR